MTIDLEPSPVTLEEAEAIQEEVRAVRCDIVEDGWRRELWQHMAVLSRARDHTERIKRECAAMIRQAENDQQQKEYVLTPRLRTLTATLLDGGKRRSIQTPFGVAGFRVKPRRIQLVDEEALYRAWEHGDVPRNLVTVKTETVTKYVHAEIAELFKQTGEVLPGCEVVEAGESFYVK